MLCKCNNLNTYEVLMVKRKKKLSLFGGYLGEGLEDFAKGKVISAEVWIGG